METWARRVEAAAEMTGERERRRHLTHEERRLAREVRRTTKRLAREARRARQPHGSSKAEGLVYAVLAVAVIIMAIRMPHLWWLLFVALGMGTRAAKAFSAASREETVTEDKDNLEGTDEKQEEATSARPAAKTHQGSVSPPQTGPTSSAVSEADARIEALCDKLLAEVRGGPPVLRDVVRNPEQTVEALRKSCLDLSRRERELRSLSSPEDDQRLAREREALESRISAEADEVTRSRLTEALAALDAQRRQRAELLVAASRLGAEHTRLYYTLENLYAQMLRVRSSDAGSSDVAGVGLRKSLEQLGEEMDAVAEALESVHRDDASRLEPIAEVTSEPQNLPGGRERV